MTRRRRRDGRVAVVPHHCPNGAAEAVVMTLGVSTECEWCEQPFRPRHGGSPQRFRGSKCRAGFWSALRRWGERAVAAGILTIDDIKNANPAACTLPGARISPPPVSQRHGDVNVSFEVGAGATAELVALGWLPASGCDNKEALTRALVDLIKRAIELRVTVATGSEGKVSFVCDIRCSTIETLVALRWLRADQRDDLPAIVIAFRRFAGRSLDIARYGGADRY
jgi:hypothetical protein